MWPFLLLFIKKDVAEFLIPHITFFFPPSSNFSFSDTKSQSNLLVLPSPLLRLSLSQVHLQPTNLSFNGNFCHCSLFFFQAIFLLAPAGWKCHTAPLSFACKYFHKPCQLVGWGHYLSCWFPLGPYTPTNVSSLYDLHYSWSVGSLGQDPFVLCLCE